MARDREALIVEWSLFGELCRALALKVATEFDPEMIVGIAKAGVIPGAVVASMLQRDFAAMAVTRIGTRTRPTLITEPPPSIRGLRVLVVDEICDTGDTLKLALLAVRKHSPAAVRSAVSFRTGAYEPDFYAVATENEIVLPWEHDALVDDEMETGWD